MSYRWADHAAASASSASWRAVRRAVRTPDGAGQPSVQGGQPLGTALRRALGGEHPAGQGGEGQLGVHLHEPLVVSHLVHLGDPVHDVPGLHRHPGAADKTAVQLAGHGVVRRREHAAGRGEEDARVRGPQRLLGQQVALPPAGCREADRHVDAHDRGPHGERGRMSPKRSQLTAPSATSAPIQPPRQPSTPSTAAVPDSAVAVTARSCQTARPCACTSAPTTPASSSRPTSPAGCATSGYEVVDHGPVDYDPVDDYPPFVLRAAAAVVNDPGSLGVVHRRLGQRRAIAANKVPGVRAALAWNDDTAGLAREHNDANVVSVGARMHTLDEATRLVERFLTTAVQRGPAARSGGSTMIAGYETSHDLPDLPAPPTGP